MVLVLTGPGTFVEQVHLGVAEGSRIPYIGRLYFLVRPQREAGHLALESGCVASPLGIQLLPELRGVPKADSAQRQR